MVWSHDPTVEHSLFPGCSHPLIFLLMNDANETQSMIVDCHGSQTESPNLIRNMNADPDHRRTSSFCGASVENWKTFLQTAKPYHD